MVLTLKMNIYTNETTHPRNKSSYVKSNDTQQGCQDHSAGKGQSFPHMVLGKLEIHVQENEVGLPSYIIDKKQPHR